MPRITRARSKKGGGPSGRQSKDQDNVIPDVYREMLAEAEARDPGGIENDRPIKKRKVRGQSVVSSAPQIEEQEDQHLSKKQDDVHSQVQTVYDSSSSDESEMEWEEVDILQAPATPIQTAPIPRGEDETLQITLDPHKDQKRTVIRRRKPVTAAEKEMRLHVHKAHLLCLLSHAQLRNLWCNDEDIQGFLKQMLTKRVISLLNPSQEQSQYTRSTTFIDGLNQASDAFLKRFRITKPGLKRAHWAEEPLSLKQRLENIMSDAEVFLSKEDFLGQAKTLQGSRDFGAQLFCALLRSAAVEARLVCSLQPLPFSGTTKQMTPIKPERQVIVISDDHDASTGDVTKWGASPAPPRARRLGRPQFKPSNPPKSFVADPHSTIRESSYPVFWVEAFNEAMQKWVPVDPLVTKSLAKSFKFEPPSSDPYNSMNYVIAFEEDASARDVTRRYSKAFNAKTRKLRVESTKNGERWWGRVMQFYEKPFLEDRDEVEISELTAKIAAEPMPRNMQDFKDHPIYALERHLRRHETIFPKRIVGHVSVSKSGSKTQGLEPIYRRSDVHALRSANKWFRLGRDIKIGEQPLKRIKSHRNQAIAVEEDGTDSEQHTETALYAYHQTEIYRPPSVVQGKVPKNAFGNLDVYVPSMVPPGGVHIKDHDARHAARLLGVDYADAVTGFDFKGRHGTAVAQGVVIANEYEEALKEVLGCLEDQKLQAELEQKSAEALRLWKHFLLRLRIAERVKSYAVEGEETDDGESIESSDYDHGIPEETGGGFIPEPNQENIGSQNVFQEYHFESLTAPKDDDFFGGGFIPEDGETHQEAAANSASEVADGASYTNGVEPSLYSLVIVSDDMNSAKSSVPFQDTARSPEASAPSQIRDKDLRSEERKLPKGFSSDTPILVQSSTAEDTPSVSNEVISHPPSAIQSHIESPMESDKGSDSNDEGSLLSHDPEDEDAIPEWLMSD